METHNFQLPPSGCLFKEFYSPSCTPLHIQDSSFLIDLPHLKNLGPDCWTLHRATNAYAITTDSTSTAMPTWQIPGVLRLNPSPPQDMTDRRYPHPLFLSQCTPNRQCTNILTNDFWPKSPTPMLPLSPLLPERTNRGTCVIPLNHFPPQDRTDRRSQCLPFTMPDLLILG